ncbi:MAG TPA: type II toxin-antitoxin system VapC family toxin [Terriglobales bacterium]
MTRAYVLDSNAVLDLLQEGKGGRRVKQLLAAALQPGTLILMSVLNLGEVLYILWQQQGEEAAQRAIASLAGVPIQLVAVELVQAFQAAEIKARHKIPYVDCIAAALAMERQATLVTSDRDFEKLGRRVQVMWLPR